MAETAFTLAKRRGFAKRAGAAAFFRPRVKPGLRALTLKRIWNILCVAHSLLFYVFSTPSADGFFLSTPGLAHGPGSRRVF